MVIFMKLKELRTERNITQDEISKYLHIGQNTYSQYESGKRQAPIEVLIKLAEYYDVSMDYLLNLTDFETHYRTKK